ncbi:uncharacterized protein [Hyperolius riggenbachi]|uniref:uncharacterized protein n=1 Tax=Hyperolius riggenbachi TaxID=752182 RepID=UPI0035A3578D
MDKTRLHLQKYKGIQWQVSFYFLCAFLCHSVSGQIHYSIVEEMRKDSIVANIAKHLGLDIKQLPSRKLQIVSDVSQKYFYVDLNNGNLYVKDRIDRETLCGAAATCFLTFDVLAENPFNVFQVNIEIKDINDNSPVFFQGSITLQILESALIGSHFALRNAEDPDIGVHSVQTYMLSESPHFILNEKISSDGSKSPELMLKESLDREIQNNLELILTALDGGDPIRTGTAVISIILKDANDNYPIFNQEIYKVTIKENIAINSTVIIVQATDKDEGSNAQITYSFTKTSGNVPHIGTFSIHPVEGVIQLTKLLDFEITKNYELSIQAMDGGGLVAHAKVLIEVDDQNDNAPDILITSLSTPIAEDSPTGTAVALIRVRDRDSGENGDIDCHIIEPVPFHLVLLSDRYYRIVTTSSMDREKVALYNITILATDKGSPPLSSKRIINLEISDVNDNPPVFTKLNYVTYIPENNLPGVLICNVKADDRDAGENAKITYSIFNINKEDILLSSYLSINVETGALYAQRSFDYENQKEFQIQITARDHGSPSLNSSSTLIIHIVDKNDNAPKILYPSPEGTGSTVFEIVPFSSEQGSLITKVVAVDADSGHNSWLSYQFIHIAEISYFSMDEFTGEIRTARVFQEKDVLNHKVVVMVRDNGQPPLSSTVTLNLAIADNVQQAVPKLINHVSEEDQSSNLQLYLIVALALISMLFIITIMLVIISKCKDSKSRPVFSHLSSSLYPQVDPRIISQYTDGTLTLPYNFCVALDSAENDFTFITPNGNIPVANLMDADDSGLGVENVTAPLAVNNQIEQWLDIVLVKGSASDTGDQGSNLSSSCSVSQHLFISGQIHYSIVEEMKKDSVIANIAKDLGLDIKQLPSRKLQIVSDVSQKYFYVDLNNGNLYVKDRIDRETLCGAAATCTLTFDVLAENPLNVFKVNVEIQDINDNSPVFFQGSITLQILESALIGSHFALKNAEDPDIGVNSVQTYKLSENPHFILNEKISSDGSKSPELMLKESLDREIQNNLELILTALDGGDPIRTGTAVISIILKDANDNYPVFNQEIYKVTIKENIAINSTVIIVQATDKDEGSNAQITYSFTKTSGNVPHIGTFSVHPVEGVIKVTKLLDFEVTKNYELSIQAMDGGGLVAHAKVLIEVQDQNDNAPDIFITSLFSPVAEDSSTGTAVALIRVRDRDSGENGDIDCQIIEVVPFHLVLLSDSYYRIVTTSSMDREKVALYNITILATDKGSPPLSSKRIINLEISDVNDNPPVFTKLNYVTYIHENNLPGALICIVKADDPDAGENAKITYSIFSINKEDIMLSSYLSINMETGALYAQRSFDYENQKEFQIQVTARDHGSPSLNSSSTLIIHIVDKNDNAPKILYPSPEGTGSTVFEIVPFSSEQGSLITKVVAVDADSGHNSWLSYQFIHIAEISYFSMDEFTGEIRTARVFQEKDILNHKVVVMVRDNGQPPLSSTVTLNLAIADNVQQAVPKLINHVGEEDQSSNLQLYLIVALALISMLFIITIMLVIISKCKDSKSLPVFSHLSSSLYPQVDPRIISQYTDGTLTLPYNFCVALDSAENDFTFITPNENIPVANLMDADDSGLGVENVTAPLAVNNQIELHE